MDTIPTWYIACQDCRRLRSSPINEGVLIDLGMEWVDEDEAESVFVGSIKNVWLEFNATQPRAPAEPAQRRSYLPMLNQSAELKRYAKNKNMRHQST